MGSPAGVTRLDATFDRNTVIREVIAWDGKNGGAAGLKADDVELLTDLWLASPDVVRLTQGDQQRFTTVEMIRLEETVLHAYQNGFGRQHAVVDLATIQTETILWQNSTGHQLGVDQAAFVQHLVSAGQQFGLGIGPAGTGKTASLAVACRAWEVAGYQPIGATVTGAAADVLAESCAIQTRTVASMVAEINTGHNPFSKRSVLIIDEASTLSNRDHASLVAAVSAAGAAMRTIGDPAQHRAVEAGGLWSQLLTTFPSEVAQLQVNRRQTAASMSDIRQASEQLRKGNGAEAVKTLAGTDRLHTAPSPTQLIADIVHDWHCSRRVRAASRRVRLAFDLSPS